MGIWGCANGALKQRVLATQQRSQALTEAEIQAGERFNHQCDGLRSDYQRWGDSNRDVAALVEVEATASTTAKDDVAHLRKTYGEAHAALQQETSGWGGSNRDVASQLRQLSEKSATMAAAQVTFSESFAPQQQEALAHVEAWKNSDESVVSEMQKLAESTDVTSNKVECDRKAFVLSAESFVSAFTPQQAEANANVAAWEASDKKVVEQMQQLAADTDACSSSITSDKDAFVQSTNNFVEMFAPQQQEALAHVAAWKNSDESVVSEMQKLAESTDATSNKVECDRAAFVESANQFVAAFAPQHTEAISNVAAWEASDQEVVSKMHSLAADTDACSAQVTSDKDTFLASSNTFADAFAPQQQEALAHVDAWKSSDDSVVTQMQTLAASINERSAHIEACAIQRTQEATAAASLVANGVVARTEANLGAVQLELGADGNEGLKASLNESGALARAKGDQLEEQVNTFETTTQRILFVLAFVYAHTNSDAIITCYNSHMWHLSFSYVFLFLHLRLLLNFLEQATEWRTAVADCLSAQSNAIEAGLAPRPELVASILTYSDAATNELTALAEFASKQQQERHEHLSSALTTHTDKWQQEASLIAQELANAQAQVQKGTSAVAAACEVHQEALTVAAADTRAVRYKRDRTNLKGLAVDGHTRFLPL